MELNAGLAEKLEQHRREHKLTANSLAKQIGVSSRTVQRWLNGERRIQARHLKLLMNYLNEPPYQSDDDTILKHVNKNWSRLLASQKLAIMEIVLKACD